MNGSSRHFSQQSGNPDAPAPPSPDAVPSSGPASVAAQAAGASDIASGQVTRVFLSCVSVEFRSYRLKLANQLGALRGRPCEVKVQEDFQQGGHTLLDSLADYVRDCDLVIHLVGEASGAQPTPEHERTLLRHLGDAADAPLPVYSYTQWEYHLARRFEKNTLVYLARPEALRDCGMPVRQSEESARLQQAHLQHILNSGEHYKKFSGHHDLVREVFFDLGLEPDLKVSNLPFKSLGILFKGREEFLETIRSTLSEAKYRGHRRVAAITASASAATVHGLGGIGKTRAAIEFAHRYADNYTALLFVRADSPEGLNANLAALCSPLVLDLPEKEAREMEVQVAAALHWLQQHPGWLLILDNVDTEAAAQAVEALLGRLSGAGQVLITSRLSRWSGAVESLALDVLTVEDAVDFLLERTANRRRKQADDADQARTLAVTLGQLALALEQAGAMMATNRYSFAQYLEEWRSRHDRVLTWCDERLMQYPMSVAVTWQTSFDHLTEAARRLLHLLAWFAADPIPESLLDVPTAGIGSSEPDTMLAPYDALSDLEAYSLATRADDVPMFAVHRLVQDVTRRSLERDAGHHALTTALSWVNAAFVGDPQDVRSWPTLELLAPHAQTCAQFADEAGLADPTSRLLNQLGLLYHTKARYAEAEPLVRRALAIDEAAYGIEHPDVVRDLNNLALLLHATNRLTEAEPLYRRALAIDEAAYGIEHPMVAIRLSNLSALLLDTNRLSEAEPMMRRALTIDEASYGTEHPRVARDLNNLALLLRETNRLTEAELLMRRALAIDEVSYGTQHPMVAIRLSNLALLLKATNRLSEAEPLYRRALAIDEASYGAEHPRVATDLNNLAQLLQDTNRLSEAEPLMRCALAIEEAAYGTEHPNVATDLNNLALLLQATNRLTEAEPLMRRALAIDKASYGIEHPNVARDLNNLAQLLKDTNRLAEAEPMMRRALAIDEASYGTDHPRVATDLNNLALLLQDTNRLTEAEPMMRRALAICEESFGADHPNVAMALNNLALLLQATNRLTEAEPLMRRALAIDKASYGIEHPNVARDLNNLSALLKDTNRLSEAEPMMRRALAICEELFGADHPNVAMALNNLALLLQATNRLTEAEPMMRRALAIDEVSYGLEHPMVAIRLNNLAQLLQATNHLSEAEAYSRRQVEIFLQFTRTTGHPHPYLQAAVNNYGNILEKMGRTREEVIAILREIAPELFGEG